MGRETVFSNLREENACIPDILERRLFFLREAGALLFPEDHFSEEELPGILADVGQEFLRLVRKTYSLPNDVLPIYKNSVSAIEATLLETDSVVFAERLSELILERGISVLQEAPLHPFPYRIAYLENAFSHVAMQYVKKHLSCAEPYAVDSLSEAAEAVSDGRCAACLLPMEDGARRPIPAFFSALDRYGFRILLDIAPKENETAVGFALLSNGFLPVEGEKRHFSCRYTPSLDAMPGAVLRAAAYFGLSLCRFQEERSSYDGKASYFLTVSLNGGRPFAFLTYLYLFSASVSFYGLYAEG